MSTRLTNEFYQRKKTATLTQKHAERETGLLRTLQTVNINVLFGMVLVVMLKMMLTRAGLSMWQKVIDANQLMASTSDVVLQELTQGACVATQTLLITQGSINADASIGHQRMLVQILLLFARGTT